MSKDWWYILKFSVAVLNLILAAWNQNIDAIVGWLVATVYIACDTPDEDSNPPHADKP